MGKMVSQLNGSGPPGAERDASRIAERVAAAWHSVDHSGRLDVPMSVVAAIATTSATAADGQDLTESLTAWITEDFAGFARTVWAKILTRRPDLATPLYPMIAWLYPHNTAQDRSDDRDDRDGHRATGNDADGADLAEWESRAQTVAVAALRAGQLALSGTARRLDTDLLGVTLTGLRASSALRTRGQFYTPAPLAQTMAAMLGVAEHTSVSDPAMGTGGMFRAVATVMRDQGLDPATVAWVGNDIDSIAVAAAAVNSLLWGLGPNVLLWTGNSLTGDAVGGYEQALAQRRELLELAALHSRIQMLSRVLTELCIESEPDSDPGQDQSTVAGAATDPGPGEVSS